ncbi:MAG: UDP-N-acetylmuramate--L-alanine ligase [Patescibacteria group bacterium]|nr:UDP-N-acetylmuramate--L-alanine ligase [Patescibacteria group bacterium]
MIHTIKSIFFLGIKGVAMANLAVILKKMGKNVSGVDLEEEFITDKLLKENNIHFQTNFDNLPENIDLFVYSAAHQGLKNPLLLKAKEKNIKIISQAELINEIMKQFSLKIAVSGCHGKTTTSSLLSYSLIKLFQKPSYLVGVPYFKNNKNEYQGADFQEKKYFVLEADEYGVAPPVDKTPKFLKINSDWIINTNIDFDHPDVYQDIEDVKKTFLKFFENKNLIINVDNENTISILNKIKAKKIITYGFSKKADYQVVDWKVNEDYSWFKIKNLGEFKISLFGVHNILNATAVIVLLLKLGFSVEKIKVAIKDFLGAKRRLELVKKTNEYMIFDDYAHHPEEIKKTILAIKERFKNKRLIVIFQPHTYSRTASLIKEFRESLSLADLCFILPIFASAREKKEDFKISSKDIVFDKKNLIYVEDEIQLNSQLHFILKKGDIIMTMGAGDVYKLKIKS